MSGADSQREPVRIANVSGFYGDDLNAMKTMLAGEPVDFITGDYLAELTMLILAKDKIRDPQGGYARTFLKQVADVAPQLKETGTKVVANAGGLNPAGLAQGLQEAFAEQNIDLTVGYVDGDDLTDRAEELGFDDPVAANAYLGAFGIVECLKSGADVVITGRVTDASVIVGPAAYHFDWGRQDFDELAGAVAAGHVIECGAQATGGNYPFFNAGEITDFIDPGFPIAEIHADGSSVITKQPGTGGAVTTGTVTAQLLYEVTGARYGNPDATLRLDHVEVEQVGPDRVALRGAKGEPPPPTTKVSVNRIGGYRTEWRMYLTGLNVEEKARMFQQQLNCTPKQPEQVDFRLERTDHPDADTQAAATASLVCVGWDSDAKVLDTWARSAIGIVLGSYPGAFPDGPPPRASTYGIYTPEYVANDVPVHTAHLRDGTAQVITPPEVTQPLGSDHTDLPLPAPPEPEPTTRMPLGTIVGARSGDKGGNANIGLWVENPAAYSWLVHTMTPAKVQELLPEAANHKVEVFALPRLNAVNILIHGLLGHGVAHGAHFDPQAKWLGEWIRSRHIDIPDSLLHNTYPLTEATTKELR